MNSALLIFATFTTPFYIAKIRSRTRRNFGFAEKFDIFHHVTLNGTWGRQILMKNLLKMAKRGTAFFENKI